MNLFSEDRRAPDRARARLCGPRIGRAGKVERKGPDRMHRCEGRATCRQTCAASGPTPHLGNDHPARPGMQKAASNAAGFSLLTVSDGPLGPYDFRSSVQKASAACQSRARVCAGGGLLPPARSLVCLEPVAADVPDARIRQHRNTYRQRFFLTGRDGGLARRLEPACPAKFVMFQIRAPVERPAHTVRARMNKVSRPDH
jgi:hypothetical protein